MNLGALLLMIVLPSIVAALILWPLLRGAAMPIVEAESDRSDIARLREQRDAALQAVQEIDAELTLGNITPEDHRSLRARYVRQAALLIREIEGREQVLDEEIERRVAARRRRAGSTASPAAQGNQHRASR